MSNSWSSRNARLGQLLSSNGNEEEDGMALDRLLHGQSVIGPTARTKEVDALRFSDRDLNVIGTLERGQYGVIHLVTCKLDGVVYVRKSIEKRFALRTRDQCSPTAERSLLLGALRTNTPWAAHLFAAFQTPTHLNLIMDYAPGGSLQDLLESSPLEGRISEADLRWWAPQLVSAVGWCHAQGFAHRDIKPNNLVLTASSHLQLIDFGSAAPLLPPSTSGRLMLAKEHCAVPCGTCDYISPEILRAHERALIQLELELEGDGGASSTEAGDNTTWYGSPGGPGPGAARSRLDDTRLDGVDGEDWGQAEAYGAETDWWSVGAVLYELVCGTTPFFAESVKTTYLRIMDHATSLRFDQTAPMTATLEDLIRNLLTDAPRRLGLQGVEDVKNHPFFVATYWEELHRKSAPSGLHTPQFEYDPAAPAPGEDDTTTHLSVDAQSNGFGWSALFQSTSGSALAASQGPSQSGTLGALVQNTPGLSRILRTPSALRASTSSAGDVSTGMSSFIGFSWGPRKDIKLLPEEPPPSMTQRTREDVQQTPRAATRTQNVYTTPLPLMKNMHATPMAFRTPAPATGLTGTARRIQRLVTPFRAGQTPFMTPARPYAPTPGPAIGRTPSTQRRRTVTEREAMQQLIDCVGMSARKAVLASGRKPRILGVGLFDQDSDGKLHTAGRDASGSRTKTRSRSVSVSTASFTDTLNQSRTRARSGSGASQSAKDTKDVNQGRRVSSTGGSVRKELRFVDAPSILGPDASRSTAQYEQSTMSRSSLGYVDIELVSSEGDGEGTETETDVPASPSPSPRPGSALSLSRRSVTPTATQSYLGIGSSLSIARPGTALGYADEKTPHSEPSSLVLSPRHEHREEEELHELEEDTDNAEDAEEDETVRLPEVDLTPQSRSSNTSSWEDMEDRHKRLMKSLDTIQLRLDRIHIR